MSHTHKDSSKTNIMCHIKNNVHLVILIAIAALVLFIVNSSLALNQNNINSESNSVFDTDWQCSIDDHPFSPITLPSSNNTIENKAVLKNTLPDKIIKGSTLLIRTSQQNLFVSVEGVEIYNSTHLNGVPQSPSSAYHFVRLPNDSAGKEITVTINSPYSRYSGLLNQIYIGSKASNIFFLIHENGLRFTLGFLMMSIGFLTMMIFLCAKGKRSRHSVIYLGAFLTCAGYWLTAESKLFQFIIPYPMTITNTGIFALTLLPIFSALYYYKTHSERLKKPVKIVIVIMSVFSFLIFILSCATPLIPVYILPLYLIIIGLYLLTFFVFILIENIKSGKGLSLSIYALFAVGFFSLGELIYYLSDTKSYNNSNLLTTGLLLFCVLLIIDTLKHFSKISKEALKVTNLTVLAYKDSLTGLKNRTAFIEKMDTLDLDAHQYISFGMFDVNNLKRTNDTLGHLVGDNLLIQSAKTLKSCLRKDDQLYRIGGDEFAAIICTQNYLDLKSLEKRLLKALAHENKQPLPYPLSIAYGYATYSPETDKDLYETLKRADALMYTKKRQQKVETY